MAHRWKVTNPVELGNAIRDARSLRDLGQGELATSTDLNRTYLSALEQGAATTQLRRLFTILNELGLDLTLSERGGELTALPGEAFRESDLLGNA